LRTDINLVGEGLAPSREILLVRNTTLGRRELMVALLSLALLVAFQLFLTRYYLDLVDEGYFAELADRVSRGELPYRDFATVYTPAVHYLHAWAFGLLGRDLVSIRLPLVAVKAALAIFLYLLARRLMPPAFAALPLMMVFATDTAPLMWEPHPAWYALLFALLCAWSIDRLIQTGADRWTVLAGMAAGLAFAFKQNVGLFAMLAAAGFLIFYSPDLPHGRARVALPLSPSPRRVHGLWLALRLLFAVSLVSALTWLIRAYLEPRVAIVFLLPVASLAVACLLHRSGRLGVKRDMEAVLGRLVWLAGSFIAVTLTWALPLLLAVGPAHLPLAQLTGSLNLVGLYWALAEPRLGLGLLLLVAAVCPLAVVRFCRPVSFRRRVVEASALLLATGQAIDLALADVVAATPSSGGERSDLWWLSVRAAEVVLLYLPSLAFWGGAVALVAAGPRLSRTEALTARWYLLGGALLLFSLYPRMDTMHVTYSGPLLFVMGAFALYQVFAVLQQRLPYQAGRAIHRGILFSALLILPAAAALPNLEWRVSSLMSRQHGVVHFDLPDYVALEVRGASLLVPASTRDAVGGVVSYIRERTSPDEPIFVYPTLPMFYFLADRPNPTRFGHVYPGSATLEEQLEMIVSLDARQVRYVVWDQFWVGEWAAAGNSDLNNALVDYLLRTFRTETMIGPFHILVRSE
jgi:hypothetical protein